MRKTLVNCSCNLIYFFVFLVLFKIEAIEGEKDSRERAFYAISSLRFHVEEVLSEIPLNTLSICFEDEDIADLWTSAALDPALFPQLDQAQNYYYQARNQTDPHLVTQCYAKTKDLLKSAWEELNIDLLTESSTAIISRKELALHHQPDSSYPNFDENPYIDQKMQAQIKPHLLPLQHVAKVTLDSIFKQSRATANEKSFSRSGFITLSIRPFSYAIIASHPDLPGYIIKAYLDSELRQKHSKPGWLWLVSRCEGAANVRQLIKAKKIRHFVVPDKWLYPLPIHPAPDHPKRRQPILLIATDMNLVSQEESEEAWKKKITHKHLDELYLILSHGFASSHLSWNIPYTKNGKFACVDTEHPKRTPHYKEVKNYLSDEMNSYWDKLVKTGGNPGKSPVK